MDEIKTITLDPPKSLMRELRALAREKGMLPDMLMSRILMNVPERILREAGEK